MQANRKCEFRWRISSGIRCTYIVLVYDALILEYIVFLYASVVSISIQLSSIRRSKTVFCEIIHFKLQKMCGILRILKTNFG